MNVGTAPLFYCLALAAIVTRAQAQPAAAKTDSSQLPAPAWVQMAELEVVDPRLKGFQSPRGIKVEIVAENALLAGATEIAFDDGGLLHVSKWTPGATNIRTQNVEHSDGRSTKFGYSAKETRDQLVVLQPGERDGVFDTATVLLDDLELPSGLLLHDGWIYWTSQGRIFRRRPHDAALLVQLQAAADEKTGPATKATPNGKWIEQRLVHGLSAVLPYQASSLAIGPDGWLYLACGGGDQRADSWDGSKAVVLRSGAIFRMRPDGSRLHECARGLARPAGLAFDELGQVFCVGDNVPGLEVPSIRFIHALAGGDYGWRHAVGASGTEFSEAALRTPDRLRAAVRGERPGTFPPTFNYCPASSGLVYRGAAFPQAFQGLLIATSPDTREVFALGLDRNGFTFEVTSRFALLTADDPRFRPAHAAIGPDGAIYIADASGRLFRLSWGGDARTAGIPLVPRDAWSKVNSASDDELWALLDSPDQIVLGRAAGRLAATASPKLLGVLIDSSRPVATRAAALFALSQRSDKETRDAIVKLLGDDDADIACLAAGTLGDAPPVEREELLAASEAVKTALSRTTDPVIERAMRIALGQLAAAGVEDAAEWGFESMSVTHRLKTSRYVFDAHVRALEMAPGWAKELMIGNLDVAIKMPEVEPEERQRLKEFVTLTAEAMRTRELAIFLDALLTGEEGLFAEIEAPLAVRLLRCYLNVQVEPPISADAVMQWIEAHPNISNDIEIAAWEIIALVGATKPEAAGRVSKRVLGKLDSALAISRRLIAGQLDRSLLPQIVASLREHADKDNSGRAASMLIELDKQVR